MEGGSKVSFFNFISGFRVTLGIKKLNCSDHSGSGFMAWEAVLQFSIRDVAMLNKLRRDYLEGLYDLISHLTLFLHQAYVHCCLEYG